MQYKNSPPILDGFTLDLATSEILAIVGRNGTGKSTLIGVLAGLVPTYTGSITFSGSPWDLKALEQTAFVFDHSHFPSFLKARQILRLFASAFKNGSETKIDDCLKLCSLDGVDKSFRHFSKGMRQSLAIAVALLKSPRLLIADEGFSSLDPEARERVFAHLKSLVRDKNVSVLFTTHSEEDCRQLADRNLRL
ncbi:MAG TPA: ABC transporter ATP-binding protein [Verrucomicrobiae bacterium]|nr:ABC transporter ATP-binding protein [Verrucomicrobiae bacterium]